MAIDGVGMNECCQLRHGELAVGRYRELPDVWVVVYEMLYSCQVRVSQSSGSLTRCQVRLEQFNEVPYSRQARVPQPSGSFTRCRARAVLRGAILGRRCSSAGERGRIQVAVNGLDGCGEQGMRVRVQGESKLWLMVWMAAQAERRAHNL